jgi:hypothetical protein
MTRRVTTELIQEYRIEEASGKGNNSLINAIASVLGKMMLSQKR